MHIRKSRIADATKFLKAFKIKENIGAGLTNPFAHQRQLVMAGFTPIWQLAKESCQEP
jgi:hypothetical protein